MFNPSNQQQERETEWLQSRLEDVDWDIKKELVNVLETNHDLWRDLLAVLPNWLSSRISVHQLENTESPACALIQKLGQWGFTLAQLIVCFESLNMDRALLIIKPDVDLEIVEDLSEYMKVENGKPLVLSCRATGFPKPNYQWFRDEKELILQNSAKLTINETSMEDSGEYYCKVYTTDRLTNQERNNPLFSRHCKVTVVESFLPRSTSFSTGRPPVIELQPLSPGDYLPQGCTFILECRATGDPPIFYQWFKDNQEIPDETKSELHLRHLFPDEDTGNSSWKFMCLVTNPFGKAVTNTVTVGLSLSTHTLFTAKDKMALLIANENYEYMQSFTLPSSDVATLTKILRDCLGFRVISYLDLTFSEMNNAVHHFCSELGKGVYGFFYFAGHGFEDQGQSYMQPIDARENCAFEENLSVDYVVASMQKHDPAMSFFLLDMCRDRPDYNSKFVERRPARSYQTKKYKNTVFGYATSFLGEAVEVEGFPNGLFVQYLKRHLAEKKSVCEILWLVKQDMNGDQLAQREGQDPFVSYNISEARSLRDPILCPRPENAIYERRWKEIYRCPEMEDFILGTFRVVITFNSHKDAFCNAIDMEIYVRDLQNMPQKEPVIISVHFKTDYLNINRKLGTDTEPVKFTIKGLQILKEPVNYTVLLQTRETGDAQLSHNCSFTLPGLSSLELTKNMLSES